MSVGLTNTATQDIGQPGMIVDAIRAGLTIRYEDDSDWVITSGMSSGGEQFNIIGYSYGSLLAAQTANFYAKQGVKIDNLVLIASPIDADFLAKLRSNKNIRQVVALDLTNRGDEIHAGMTQAELLNPYFLKKLSEDMLTGKGQGHFYYGHPVPELPQRLEILANWLRFSLYNKGNILHREIRCLCNPIDLGRYFIFTYWICFFNTWRI